MPRWRGGGGNGKTIDEIIRLMTPGWWWGEGGVGKEVGMERDSISYYYSTIRRWNVYEWRGGHGIKTAKGRGRLTHTHTHVRAYYDFGIKSRRSRGEFSGDRDCVEGLGGAAGIFDEFRGE